MTLRTSINASILAIAAALSLNAASAADSSTVTSSSQRQIDKSYGRAGGLIGSDRVSGLSAGGNPIGISYDHDIAARTNMSTDRPIGATVGVSYDEAVAARTNMPRGRDASWVAGKASNGKVN